MKRKFVTEYAIGYMNNYTSMVTAHQLLQNDEIINKEHEEHLAKCHIYIIASRPSAYFDPDSLSHENNKLSGTLCYKINGIEHKVHFEEYPWEFEKDSVSLDCKYPFKEISCLNPQGKEVSYLPAFFLASGYLYDEKDLSNFEVLYVGQAQGKQGKRSALERLKSHSTFQKILASTNYDYPDKEIVVFMYQFEHGQILSSIDGRAKDADNTAENEVRLVNAMQNPPKKNQKIGMIEAGLIRYFQPHYNQIYKTKFPSTKHRVLKSCNDLDISGLVVELDSSDLKYRLYSQTVEPSDHHIAQFDLVAAQNRMSFFSATGFTKSPEVIE